MPGIILGLEIYYKETIERNLFMEFITYGREPEGEVYDKKQEINVSYRMLECHVDTEKTKKGRKSLEARGTES